MIVTHILLNFFGMNIKIQDTVSKCIQKVSIVGNDQTGFLIVNKKLCEVFDTGFVEIVGRLIKKQDVRILNKCRGQKQACLLTTGKGFDDAVFGINDPFGSRFCRLQIDDFKD